MKQVIRIGVLALVGLACGPALAGKGGPPPPTRTTTVVGEEEVNDNEFFVGINWQFGGKSQAELVVGYRDVDVNSNGDVKGAGIDMTFPLTGGFRAGELRLKGIDGKDDLTGEYGAGWSFDENAFLVTGAAQAEFVTFGTDYLFGKGKGWRPYAGLNTVSGYTPPPYRTVSNVSCPAPFELSPDQLSCNFPQSD
ncbi:hypothetical protein [Arenimonas oryziterrae]|uniref:Porin domain-containing protein n=1 Tax=Arenimonas oryziterrae DSM 21050 = YC6267 TaxID=1121015 RepID=A0A091BIR3_9GAMM|nr:hypothetical protein [Arenimonas oryziterrae]KFN44230.1 hypothetical protein N789_07370 [Arenimonas oryziterrae DSM 21050 = YC6267]